jgi:hypothetical protein
VTIVNDNLPEEHCRIISNFAWMMWWKLRFFTIRRGRSQRLARKTFYVKGVKRHANDVEDKGTGEGRTVGFRHTRTQWLHHEG